MTKEPKALFTKMDSPIGRLTLIADETHLLAILWEKEKKNRVRLPRLIAGENSLLKKTKKQLEEYFAGRRFQFDLPIAPHGTPFQIKVWHGLRKIPYGKTLCYQELATQIGSSKAVRAVGAANGKNPLSIIVPCHRVIGKNGKLTGFAGGLSVKNYLLKLESRNLK